MSSLRVFRMPVSLLRHKVRKHPEHIANIEIVAVVASRISGWHLDDNEIVTGQHCF